MDDHLIFAEALAARLRAEPDIEPVGIVRTGAELDACMARQRPSVVLMDLELEEEDGMTLTRRLRARIPDVRIVIVTCRNDPETAAEALTSGANGWVEKEARGEQLVRAIRGVVDGETWVPSKLLTEIISFIVAARQEADAAEVALAALTERERQVLEGLARGLDRAAIGRSLVLSRNTVSTHVQRILSKLEVHSSLEAVAIARRAGGRHLFPFSHDRSVSGGPWTRGVATAGVQQKL